MPMKIILTIVALTMALTLILTSMNSHEKPLFRLLGPPSIDLANLGSPPMQHSSKRVVSRFLEQNVKERSPRAADHCKRDNDICGVIEGFGRNTTCCNNKCLDLNYDDNNCGACKIKCMFTETCCRGECVSLAYDKRNCGACNTRCMPGGYCIYGMCDYA